MRKLQMLVNYCVRIWIIASILIITGLPAALASSGGADALGNKLSLWTVIPFAGILLSIAIVPLLHGKWWDHNMGKVSLFWALLFVIPFAFEFGLNTAIYHVLHIVTLDYIPFIILVGALYIITGGVAVKGDLPATPVFNTGMLFIGSLLASVIGTTGATMLLLRPLLSANRHRVKRAHTIMWCIFLVSNIGGSLTPIGDPPLFIGFLHGIPFFWTLKLAGIYFFNILLLLAMYYRVERTYYRQEMAHCLKPLGNIDVAKNNTHKEVLSNIQFVGLKNFIFLAGVLASVIMSGLLANHSLFYDEVTRTARGITIFAEHGHDLIIPWLNILRDALILVMAALSLKFTTREIRQENNFTWHPINHVAILFAGIFVTIVPALALLQARGNELGVTSAAQFFWATGILSSFLDNTPTYLAFLSLGSQLGSTVGIATDMGIVSEKVLMAISCGAVFMGANTYIGNAPNFMVKSIAEEEGIKMPSFFGYMGWSMIILIPVFILNTLIFFS